MKKNSIAWKTIKSPWNSSLLKKIKKKKKLWKGRIMKLPEKWQEVMEQNSEYVVQYSSW